MASTQHSALPGKALPQQKQHRSRVAAEVATCLQNQELPAYPIENVFKASSSERFTNRNTGDSSVGRASDCRSLQISDGPWFDSGSPDYFAALDDDESRRVAQYL